MEELETAIKQTKPPNEKSIISATKTLKEGALAPRKPGSSSVSLNRASDFVRSNSTLQNVEIGDRRWMSGP